MEYVDKRIRESRLPRSSAMGSVSRSDVYHDIQDDPERYTLFNIEEELTDPIDTSINIPTPADPLFVDHDTDIPERSVKDKKKRNVTKKGTQDLMFERVHSWKPHGRAMDARSQDIPNLGRNKCDVILREAHLGGQLSIMALIEMKKLPAGRIATKEFAPDEMGQCLEFGMKVLDKQPWRPHVFVVLSDTRRFKFFKISRMGSGQMFQHSKIFLDANGWSVLRLLVCQTANTLGYVQCSVDGWSIGKILGIGGTAVVAEAKQSGQPFALGQPMDAVAKMYTGTDALNYRNQEAAALEALKHIPNIPFLIQGAPSTTIAGKPVLLKYPRGYSAGNEVFALIGDYSPLVDVLRAVHSAGWLHNDVAPANIFFETVADNEPPKVFLNDFGSATKRNVFNLANAVKSRQLFYSSDASSHSFVFGPMADLRALVLSIFVLTQKNAFDSMKVTTANQLIEVMSRAAPWKNALIAATNEDYEGVKAALNSTVER
jgi:hypothetical protein